MTTKTKTKTKLPTWAQDEAFVGWLKSDGLGQGTINHIIRGPDVNCTAPMRETIEELSVLVELQYKAWCGRGTPMKFETVLPNEDFQSGWGVLNHATGEIVFTAHHYALCDEKVKELHTALEPVPVNDPKSTTKWKWKRVDKWTHVCLVGRHVFELEKTTISPRGHMVWVFSIDHQRIKERSGALASDTLAEAKDRASAIFTEWKKRRYTAKPKKR